MSKTKRELREALSKIVGLKWTSYSDAHLSLNQYPDGDLALSYSQMYNTPPKPDLKLGMALLELFGAEDVKLDYGTISEQGCKTCDYGSNYGWDLLIVKPTKNKDISINWSSRDKHYQD